MSFGTGKDKFPLFKYISALAQDITSGPNKMCHIVLRGFQNRNNNNKTSFSSCLFIWTSNFTFFVCSLNSALSQTLFLVLIKFVGSYLDHFCSIPIQFQVNPLTF